jgi:hypothetical protein
VASSGEAEAVGRERYLLAARRNGALSYERDRLFAADRRHGLTFPPQVRGFDARPCVCLVAGTTPAVRQRLS